MQFKDRIQEALRAVKANKISTENLDDVSYLAFIVSLFPVPVMQQIAQLIGRWAGSESGSKKLQDLWDVINQTNDRIKTLEDEMEKAIDIAATSQRNNQIRTMLDDLYQAIEAEAQKQTSWNLETENRSYQHVLNSYVKANRVEIEATGHSQNIIDNTDIIADQTRLHASEGSSNYFESTKFTGASESVGMHGVQTEGPLEVRGSSIRFYKGGSVKLFSKPRLVKLNCQECAHEMRIDRRKIETGLIVDCPNCGFSYMIEVVQGDHR